jgi:glutathione S-transferase
MKLYDSAVAPNPRRVRIFLAEKGISVPTVQVDIGKRENRQPEFLAKNPYGGLPVLELDDGSYIAESIAICRYFEEIQPRPALFGEDAKGARRSRCGSGAWSSACSTWSRAASEHARLLLRGRIKQSPDYGEVANTTPLDRLAWLGRPARHPEFIAGDKYLVADITTLCAIDFGRPVNIRVPAELSNVTRWHKDVSSRPSAKA